MAQRLTTLYKTLNGAFYNCMQRFPVTVGFVLALTAYLCFQITMEGNLGEKRLLMTIGYYLSVGTLLSLSLHLWAEEVKRASVRTGVQVTVHALLAIDAIFLYYLNDSPRLIDIIIAHGAGILAVGLSIFFLPFFREENDIPSWNFTQYVLATIGLVFIIGAVMSGGLCLLAFSLHQLFGIVISSKCYLYILILFLLLLPALLFLGLLPKDERKHDRQPQPTVFMYNIIRNLFLPLIGGYLAVLYVYASTIIARWELPNGWVSWLVTALMTGCIAIELGLYPSRIKNQKPIDERIARWLPALILPLLLLMTIGIGRRFLDYGITLNRLYLATLNVWFYFVCIGLIARKARRISWIPISFSIIFLLTSALPVNYASITRNTLRKEVKALMAQSKLDTLPLSEKQYKAWLKSLPEGGKQVNEKLYYLSEIFGEESIADLVNKEISFYDIREEQTSDVRNLYYQSEINNQKIPEGYTRLTSVSINQRFSNQDAEKEKVSITLPLSDTLCLPLDTLHALDKNNTSTPPILRTQAGNTLLLSSFHIYKEKEETQVILDGLLFHHEQTYKK